MSERLKQFERVGCGAMAEVYRGALLGERGTSRKVAIKRLRSEIAKDPAAVELFVNEARIAVRLDHPNVVHALELCRDADGYALVCEWLDCMPLAELVENGVGLQPGTVIHIGVCVAHALSYLHGLKGDDGAPLGLVHRDVTPANVFITQSGEVKLSDFGVAWCERDGAWVEAAAGTPEFAAPEQLRRGVIDGRADIFGLGATLRKIEGDSSKGLRAALAKACADEPDERYENATQFADALGECGISLDAVAATRELVALAAMKKERRCRAPEIDRAVQSILGGAIALPVRAEPFVNPRRGKRIRFVPFTLAVLALATPAAIYLGIGNGIGVLQTATEVVPTNAAMEAPTPLVAAPSLPPLTSAGTPSSSTVSQLMKRQKPIATGMVSLNAIPWAHVKIDGRDVGNTPVKAMLLPAGRHRVILEHPPQKLSRELSIDVDGDCSQTFLVNLRQGTVQKRKHSP